MMNETPTNANEACRQMVPIVKSLVGKWLRGHYGTYDDLYQEGMMGVVEAWNRFDHGRNNKFSTYAFFWVRKRIKEAAAKNWNHMNNTAPEEWAPAESNYQSMDIDAVSVAHEITKLPAADQELIRMRAEGYTFDEIREKTGAKSLMSVYNRVNAITASLDPA
ncbi:MAG: sigma-70 family RNA polymerase sigma factor [Weeksellaceae bacterium]